MSALLLALLVTASPAENEEAKRFFRAGARAYEAGQYDAACRALEAAYAISPLPAVAFSLAQAYRLRYFADADPEHLRRAKSLYEAYLEKTPSGTRRHDATTALAEIAPLLANLEPAQSRVEPLTKPTQIMVTSQTNGARISIDGGPPLEAPATIEVAPGPHEVRVFADGFHDEVKQTLAVAERLIVEEIELRPKPALIKLTGDRGTFYVDGVVVAPADEAFAIPAGARKLTVTRNGARRWDRTLELSRGQELTLDVDLRMTGQRLTAWIVMGSGAAIGLLGGAVTLGALGANRRASDLAEKLDREGLTPAELVDYDRSVQERDNLRLFAGATFGVSALVIATGLLLYLFDEPTVEPSVINVGPLLGEQTGAALHGTF